LIDFISAPVPSLEKPNLFHEKGPIQPQGKDQRVVALVELRKSNLFGRSLEAALVNWAPLQTRMAAIAGRASSAGD